MVIISRRTDDQGVDGCIRQSFPKRSFCYERVVWSKIDRVCFATFGGGFRLDRYQQRFDKCIAKAFAHRDPLISNMPDAFCMRTVAVGNESDLFKVAAPAASRVADKAAVFAG